MKSLVTSPFYSISDRPTSHKSAQAFIYADMVGVDLNVGGKSNIHDYDALYVYHGNDFFGSLNLFGGLGNESNAVHIKELSHFKGGVISLGISFPDYGALLKPRMDKHPHPAIWDGIDFERLSQFTKSPVSKFPNLRNNRAIIGDSHAISLYDGETVVNSVPFQTLHGALKLGLESFVPAYYNEVWCYFGNIDIRHHLARHGPEAIDVLAKEYVRQAEKLSTCVVKIFEPLPIENESRAVPKTGFYKGTPFFGTWQERNDIRSRFIESLNKYSSRVEIVNWTKYLLNDKGELDFAHMEKPRSIHLARSSYPFWTGIKKRSSLETF